jgi:LPXTG-motif cell wall-anchored protein
MYRKASRITTAVVLCLALGAVAAPSAFAEPRGLADIDPQLAAAVQQAEQAATTPDDRAYSRGVTPAPSGQSLSPDDRPLFRGVETPPVAPSVVSVSDSSAFHWGDASIGAATTLGLFLLGGVMLFALRRRRHLTAAL